MSTLLIALRDPLLARQAQARLEATRGWQVIGVAHNQYRARGALNTLDPDALLIDSRLEDGVALSLVHELRLRGAERPKVMVVAEDAADLILFATMQAGADAYMLSDEHAICASRLDRMIQGEATMAAPIARQALHYFGELPLVPHAMPPANDRDLDWRTHGSNPMRLSPGEVRLLQLLAHGSKSGELAARTALSLEAVGRRIANVYRKLSWDVRSGSLALLAA